MARKTTLEQKRVEIKSAVRKYEPQIYDDETGEMRVVDPAEVDVMNENEIDAMLHIIKVQRQGGTARFANVVELQTAISDYWASIIKSRKKGSDIFPDVEGVCSYLGISRETIMRWKRENYNGFGETIDILFTNIAAVKKQVAMHGGMPALVFTVDMNNNHGYINTSKVDVTNNNAPSVPDSTTLLEQIRELPDMDTD